jgi:hypothetical protein
MLSIVPVMANGASIHQLPRLSWMKFNLRDGRLLLMFETHWRGAVCRSRGCYSSFSRSSYWPELVGGAANACARAQRDMSIRRPGNRNTGKKSTIEEEPLSSACSERSYGRWIGKSNSLMMQMGIALIISGGRSKPSAMRPSSIEQGLEPMQTRPRQGHSSRGDRKDGQKIARKARKKNSDFGTVDPSTALRSTHDLACLLAGVACVAQARKRSSPR